MTPHGTLSNREKLLAELHALLPDVDADVFSKVAGVASKRLSIAAKEGAVVVLELSARRLQQVEPTHWFISTLRTMADNERHACRCKEDLIA